jgi:hypothetical protein
MVTDPPANPSNRPHATDTVDLEGLPKRGRAIPVGLDAVRMPLVVGEGTDEGRPDRQGVRTWGNTGM